MPMRFFLLCLFAVFLSCGGSRGSISLRSSSLPPSFDIHGRQELQWIWFQGPYKNRIDGGPEPPTSSDPKRIILWEIHPPDSRFIPMDQIPLLTYGQLPSGWKQKLPAGGSAPEALKDGYVYSVQIVSVIGPDLKMCIAIKNGQVSPYQEVGENLICGK